MSKTTKLWISPEMELRWNEWPVMPPHNHALHDLDKQTKIFNAALAKAKAESILVELSDGARQELLTSQPKSDTFIDFEGEVEVIEQWKHTGLGGIGWRDDTEDTCWKMANAGYYTRQVARLVPQAKYVKDNALPDANDKDVASMAFSPSVITEGYRFSIVFSDGKLRASVPHGSCYHVKNISSESIDLLILDPKGDIVSLSPGDTKIFGEDLQQQIDAANARIKELESFVATEDYDPRTIKARILEAFKPAWNSRQVLRMNATEVLAQVLDELKIK